MLEWGFSVSSAYYGQPSFESKPGMKIFSTKTYYEISVQLFD